MTETATTGRTTHRWGRILLAIALMVSGIALVGFWWVVHRTLPQLDGDLTLPGLRGEVQVDRDTHGVPHIQAATEEDLAEAQGYVLAQDRLWQMDVLRRVAGGELAEIFGPRALPVDRENRALGLRQAAEQAAGASDAETQKLLEAYARGVNEFIAQHNGALPIEFSLLQYKPRPWTPADTYLVSGFMYQVLTTSWREELNRERITAKVGPERAKEMYVIDSPLDHFIVGAPAGGPPATSAPTILPTPRRPPSNEEHATAALWDTVADFLQQFRGESNDLIGSNNFVVSGAHTASGKPLLANDTHLALSVPCIWYMVHLTAPGWNVMGFALPGVPMVILGHNDRIAWGFTNVGADVQDLYKESFNPANRMQYRVNGAWVDAQVRREVIRVRGAPDENYDVLVTRHGPILYGEGHTGYALKWVATQPGGMDFGYPLLGRAKNWEEFREVFRHVAGPAQNAVYADVDGHIGFFIGAHIPIRKNGDGSVPVPGDTDEYEWTGYIPYDELPQAIDPPGGIIATANARTVGPAYKYFLTERWASPSRTARIYALLDSRRDLHASDCIAIQTDIVSLPDQLLAADLRRAGAAHPPLDARARDLISQLASWDGGSAADSALPSFVAYTRHELFLKILQPFLGGNSYDYEWWSTTEYANTWFRSGVFLGNVLRNRPAEWLPKPYADYDALLAAAADDAVKDLVRDTQDEKPSGWMWGRINALQIYHPLGQAGLLRSLLSFGPIPQSGSVYSVKAMGRTHGPAMRFVADTSDWDNSLMNVTLGESGQYGSRYYQDQFDAWFKGYGLPAPFSQAGEAIARAHRLKLHPPQ